jgi:hypothetical protein
MTSIHAVRMGVSMQVATDLASYPTLAGSIFEWCKPTLQTSMHSMCHHAAFRRFDLAAQCCMLSTSWASVRDTRNAMRLAPDRPISSS